MLLRRRTQVGMGLPDLWRYYQAAQLSQFSVVYSQGNRPDWVDMERQAIPLHTIDYLAWTPHKHRPPIMAPTLSHSMALCDFLYKSPNLISELCPLAHIFNNPHFPPGQDIRAFQWWTNKGLFRIGHFLSLMGPLTADHCSRNLEMPPSERFHLHQIRHFILSLWTTKPKTLHITAYEQWCSGVMDQRGGISKIYASLTENIEKPSYAMGWEQDLQVSWNENMWFSKFQKAFKGISNVALIEANAKIIKHWYNVPLRVAKIFPGSSPLRFRSCGLTGSLYHIWWECPRIRGLWNKVFSSICKVTGIPVPKTPEIALLNGNPVGCAKPLQTLVHFILLGTKITIARAWKQPTVSLAAVKRKISWVMVQEKTVSILQSTTEKHDTVREPWKTYIHKLSQYS